jgi:hypothetical protein
LIDVAWSSTQKVIAPRSPVLAIIGVHFYNMSSADFDLLVNRVHQNAVEFGIQNGEFLYYFPAISGQALDKLEELKEVYGWTVM